MRIVHVIDYFQPRLGYQETYLVREQIRLGHESLVVTSDRYRKKFYQDGGASSFLGSRKRSVGLSKEEGILVHRLPTLMEIGSRIWLKGLETVLIQLKPDTIHLHGMNSLTAIRVAIAHLRYIPLRSSTLVVDDHMYRAVSRSWLRVFYPISRIAVFPIIRRSADCIIAVSKATRTFMVDFYGLAGHEIGIIRLGVAPSLFRPDSSARQFIRNKLSITESEIVCIYTGKIMPQKQLDTLLKAASKLCPSYPELKFLFVGYASETYLKQLKGLAGTLKITDRIIWLPAVSQLELAQLFAASDIAVWPSEHSISFLEAMSCGLPLVVGDSPKSSEEVAYNNGFTFPLGDHLALAAHLRMLLNSPGLRASMGAASRQAVETHYSWSAINERFMRCYNQPSGAYRTS